MKMKRLLAFFLAAVTALSVLGGCGKDTKEPDNQGGSVIDDGQDNKKEIVFPLAETMSFTGCCTTHNGFKLGDSKGWQLSLERANISVKLTEFDKAELVEKTNLMLTGGTYPDFFIKNATGSGNDSKDGILIPLEELIREYAPNCAALLDKYDGWKWITAADGHVYSMPCIQEDDMPYGDNAPAWINKRWLDNLGLKEPTTMEELDAVLTAFKEKDANGNGDPNDEVPFTFATNTLTVEKLLQYGGEGVNLYKMFVTIKDHAVEFMPLTDDFKDNYLYWLSKWYQAGIIDQNAFVQDYNEMTVNGKAADIHGMFFRFDPSSQVGLENASDYVLLKVFGDNGLTLGSNVLSHAMSITDKCENPEVLVAWADWFYTEEGSMVAEYGIKGESYELNEDGTYYLLTPEGVAAEDFLAGYRIYGSASAPMLRTSLKIDPNVDALNAYLYDVKTSVYKDGTVVPYFLYTEEETTRKADLETQIKDYITVYTAQVATGDLDLESSYADFQKNLIKMGAEELQEIYRNAYERGGN